MIDLELTSSRILIVEDNVSNVDQLEQLLELNGFVDVKSVLDSRKVEQVLPEYRPDIILLDLHMPHLDGFQVLEWIRKTVPADDFLPVIVLTADINPASRERALTLGAMDFLNKPYDFTETILRITNLLRTRHLHDQLRRSNDELEAKVEERTAELKRMQAELLAQERYKTMGQMASGIVHDFSNVIAVMMGHSELYLSFPDLLDDKSKLHETFQTIQTAAEDASSIVRHLREFYKAYNQEGEQDSVVELDVVVRGAIGLTRPKWRDQAQAAGTSIVIETELEAVQVRMTPSTMREILTNLIFNAVDAMPEGGTISIRSRLAGHQAVLEIEDTGIGMSEEVKSRCLEMFYSTKGAKGTGLGLGMVQEILRKHKGRIDIRTVEGQGTCFTLYLPLALELVEQGSEEVPRLDCALNILVVDDDAKIREILETFLTQDGHLVTVANNGKDGLVAFIADQFDLVITDQAMPLINGQQLAQSIRRQDWTGPIVMMTGFADQMKEEGEIPETVTALMGKPVQFNMLRKFLFDTFAGRSR